MKQSNNTSGNTVSDQPKFSSREFMAFSFVMLVILSIVVTMPLVPNDFFPYLRIGDEILRIQGIPPTEFMTYTQFGNPAFYPHWLFSLVFLGIYRAGGAALTAFLSMLLIGVFYLMLWISMRDHGVGILTSILIMLYIAFIHAGFFAIRPQLITYPLLGLATYIISRWMKNDNRYLWLFPVISFLWVNFHGSFIVVFLILIPALIFGSGNRKRLLVITAISFVSTFLNLFTVDSWRYLFSMVNSEVLQEYITEWQPPVNQGWQMNLFFGGLLIIPVLLVVLKPKIKMVYWIWFLGFGWMALTSIRYLIWFLPFLGLILAQLIQPLAQRISLKTDRFQNRSLNILLGVILLLFPLTLLPGARQQWLMDPSPIHNHLTPVEATQWLKKNPQLPDNIWSDFNYATYFTYELPQRKLYMSNRIQDVTDELLSDYILITNAVYNWPILLDKYQVNTLVLNIENQPNLIEAVVSSLEWEEKYRDHQTIIFSRYQPLVFD